MGLCHQLYQLPRLTTRWRQTQTVLDTRRTLENLDTTKFLDSALEKALKRSYVQMTVAHAQQIFFWLPLK